MNKISLDEICNDINYILKISRKSNMKFKLVALIIDSNNKIITYGYNYNVPLKNGRNKYSIHAEEMAIHRLFHSQKYNPDKEYRIVIVRPNRSGNALLKSNPCDRCRTIIESIGMKCYYVEDKLLISEAV